MGIASVAASPMAWEHHYGIVVGIAAWAWFAHACWNKQRPWVLGWLFLCLNFLLAFRLLYRVYRRGWNVLQSYLIHRVSDANVVYGAVHVAGVVNITRCSGCSALALKLRSGPWLWSCFRRGRGRRCLRGRRGAASRTAGDEDAGGGGSDGTADGDGSAVDVDAVEGEAEFPGYAEGLDREGFVEFEEVDVVEGPVGAGEDFLAPVTGASMTQRGATPLVACARMVASGLRWRSRARSADMRTTAAAASLTPGAMPAVTVPSFECWLEGGERFE